ncbi:MAG TPA: ComEC/Rec2 family competence protein, partial [Rhodanobacteraceae bacterium]|nr:ComEC/Rec2 family competence protein [Rhodanobacteraceae bacterium]
MATELPSPFSLKPRHAVALLAGVAVVQACATLPPMWCTILSAIAACAALRLPRLRLAAITLLGFAWCAWRAGMVLDARLPESLEGRDLDVIGIVDDLPQARPDALRATLRIESGFRGRARIAWYGAPAGAFAPCTRWHLRVRLKRPRGLVNPGGFDAERSALERRIVATGYVRDDDGNAQVGAPGACIDGLRARLSDDIAARIADPHDAALVRAFALGDTRGLDDDDWEVARINGVPHLIAISGFHVGVAAGLGVLLVRLIGWLFPRTGTRVPIGALATPAALVTAIAYGLLAGGSLPTVRTLLMIAVVALARLGRRSGNPAQTLSLALVTILAADPLAVLSAGFWLSFVGVAFLNLCLERRRGFF